MKNNRIPYEIILSAHSGDEDALRYILWHYSGLIEFFSRRSLYDDYGNRYEFIDQDIRQNIETVLVQQIVMKFDPTILPHE